MGAPVSLSRSSSRPAATRTAKSSASTCGRPAINSPSLARTLSEIRDLAREWEFGGEIAAVLTHEIALAIDAAHEVEHDRRRGWLTRALRYAVALARVLEERQVDVSGADLSEMDINPALLNGAIWTHQTSWPPGVASPVRAHSTEIRPGVYQVRLGSTPDRDFLALS